MPEYVVQRVADALNSVRKPLNGSRIHLFGVAYKKDVGDVRESPALDIIELLARRGAVVTYTDPYVARLTHAGHTFESLPFPSRETCDCAVIATDHALFDYDRIAAMALVVDTRNALKTTAPHIFRL